MVAEHCNFAERELEAWVSATLEGYRSAPDTIPPDGDTWLLDRGGPNSVPGLRLRREEGAFTLEAPRLDFYLLRKFDGRKPALKHEPGIPLSAASPGAGVVRRCPRRAG